MAGIIDKPKGIDNLPVEIVELILLKMDNNALLKMTEVSKTFSDIVRNNEKLTSKLILRFMFPSNLTRFALDMLHSNRSYRKLSIVRTRERIEFDDRLCQRIFVKLGQTVKDLTIDWSMAQRSRGERRMLELNNQHRAFIEELHRRRDMPPDQMRAMEEAYIQNIIMRHRHLDQIVFPDDLQIEFANVLRHFSHVEKLCLQFVHLESHQFDAMHIQGMRRPVGERFDEEESDEEIPELEPPGGELAEVNVATQFSQLRDVVLIRCDAHCFRFLTSATQIQKLHVVEALWPNRDPGVDIFERFLVSQTCLKSLHLEKVEISQMFRADRSADIRFQLDSLVLKNVYLQERHILNEFLSTQTELKSIDFTLKNYRFEQLDAINRFHHILTTICSMKKMQSITINKRRYKLENVEFLYNISNPAVEILSFSVTAEDKTYDLFKAFIRMFPSLKSITFEAEESDEPDVSSRICFESDTILDKVRTLSITNASVRSLDRITVPLLETFTYFPGKTGESIDFLLSDFFRRHHSIKHLVIGDESRSSYFFTTFVLCEKIILLSQLESIAIYNFEKINMSVKLLMENLPKLKTLKMSTADSRQLTSASKERCAKRGLELIYDRPEVFQLSQPQEDPLIASNESN